jgi:hypothetical protein
MFGRASRTLSDVTTGPAPTTVHGPLLLADISGYTSFLQSVAAAHRDDAFANGAVPDAYAMMSDLLGGIVERVVPPFTLAKLEGDGGTELVGPEVVMAHRLLKTEAASLVGHAYALVTEDAAALFDVPTDGGVPVVETYEHYAPVRAHVFPLPAEG